MTTSEITISTTDSIAAKVRSADTFSCSQTDTGRKVKP